MPTLPRGYDQLRLSFALVALTTAAGALVGALVGALDHALRGPVRDEGRRHAVLLAAPMTAVAWALFTGGRMRRLPATGLLKPVVALALLLVATLALTLFRRGVRALLAASAPRRGGAAAGLALAALLLHAADLRVLPRLYAYLHGGLGLIAGALLGAAVMVLAPRLLRASARVAAVAAVLAVAPGVVAWRLLEGWPNVRAAVYDVRAPSARSVALAVSGVMPARRNPLGDPEAIRRAQAALGGARALVRGGPVRPLAHVLLVTVDALRADRIGRVVAGRSLTPNLDAMDRDTVIFDRAITQAPHSSYAISSLHTGEYLHETIPLGQRQPLPTLADTLRARGFNTVGLYTNGIFFTEGERLFAYRDARFGFARASHVDHDARAQTDAAITELDDAARRGGPTFLWVHYFDVHAPYWGHGDTPEARYDDAVRRVDGEVARLLGHARRVLQGEVVFALTADHGEEFGEHGGVYHGSTLYEEQLRVPLRIMVPGVRGRRVPTEVCAQLVDLAPTLAALVGVEPPASMRGRDLRRWMVDGANPADAPPAFAAVNSRRAVIRWPWKFVVDTTYGVEELIELRSDPMERRNRAADAAGPRGELRAMLGAWIAGMSSQSADGEVLARGRLGDRGVIPALITLAEDRRESSARRVEALDLLSRFRSLGPGDFLVPLMRDGDPRVRAMAALVSGNARDPRSVPTLREVVVGEDPALRARAGIALGNLGDPAGLDALADAIFSRDEETSVEAVKALGELRDPRGVDPLLRVLADDHLRYRAVFALGQIGDPRAFERVMDVASHDDTEDARANGILALGMLRDPRAREFLEGRVRADDRADYAAAALAALPGEVPWFDARRYERAAPQGFVRCASYRAGWPLRELRPLACSSAPTARAFTLPMTVPEGEAVLVLRARVDEGERGVTLRVGGAEVGRVTSRRGGSRCGFPCRARGRAALDLDAPATLEVAHAVAVTRSRR
ncbi:MAG: HEAT repeat domain-containing protein [Polyangiales bacterium]